MHDCQWLRFRAVSITTPICQTPVDSFPEAWSRCPCRSFYRRKRLTLSMGDRFRVQSRRSAHGRQGEVTNVRSVEFHCEKQGLAGRPIWRKLTGRFGHGIVSQCKTLTGSNLSEATASLGQEPVMCRGTPWRARRGAAECQV